MNRLAGMETSSMTGASNAAIRAAETRDADSPRDAARRAGAVHAVARSAVPFYAPIASHLAEVERRLQSELQSQYESLAPLLRHGVQLGGKRLRPALVLLAGACVNASKVNAHHEVLGAVLEMVHTATLIHDDVLDEATSRRHVPTINAGWGDHASILLGDYLFSQAFRLSSTTGSTQACEWIGEAARRVCEGELRQVLARDQMDLDQASYIEMIRGKTAELCSVACRLGASFAGGTESEVSALSCYGDSLGIAFQIADDYLDIWGDPDTVGKTLGTDLEQGKWTLPILRLRETATPALARRIDGALQGPSSDRHRLLMPLLNASDAREYTRQTAIHYRDVACDSLRALPESASKHSLIELATFAIDRTF
jgi:octaprenyl-diphosphate synthase